MFKLKTAVQSCLELILQMAEALATPRSVTIICQMIFTSTLKGIRSRPSGKVSLIILQDWKREGQKLREDIDCGIVTYKCRRCSASFTRAKDAAYHEKRCEECQCTTCCKVFSSKLSLARHMNIHSAKYECETCHKTFATKHILVRHTKVHSKDKDFTCHSCNAKFKTKFSQERHEKNCK